MKLNDHLSEFLAEFGGRSFNKGLLRTLECDEIGHWAELMSAVFPPFYGRVQPFAYNTTGAIFALNITRVRNDIPIVTYFDPMLGEAKNVDRTLDQTIEDGFLKSYDRFLGTAFYKDWVKAGGKPPARHQCIGMKVPLFLGGEDSVDNLELIDMDVYWNFLGQILEQTRDLPDGTKISKIITTP
jgi:hypothetical protein